MTIYDALKMAMQEGYTPEHAFHFEYYPRDEYYSIIFDDNKTQQEIKVYDDRYEVWYYKDSHTLVIKHEGAR